MHLQEETFFGSQCMFVCDQISLMILDLNDIALQKLGFDRKKILGTKLTDLGEEVDLTKESKLSKEMIETLEEVWQLRSSNGEYCHVQFSSHLINYKGKPAKLVVAHDIEALFEVKGKARRSVSSPIGFENFPMAEIEWNMDLKILRWSVKAEELFGWTQEEAISNKTLLKDFVHPEDLSLVRQELNNSVNKQNRTNSIVNRNFTKSGKTIYCEWYNSFLFDEDGNVVSVYSLVVDISARVEAMERSRRSMQSYRDLFDSISDAIYLINDNGEILGANEGLKQTFGYQPKDVIGKHFKILSAPGKFDGDRLFDLRKKGKLGKRGKFEGWGKKVNGEVFPSEMLVNTGSYFGEDVLIIIERDISERKLAEEELQKREQLFSELFNMSPLGIVLLNEHSEIMMVNKGFEEIFEFTQDDIHGLELDKVIVPEDQFEHAKQLTATPNVSEEVCKRITKSGDLVDVIIYAVPILIDGKVIARYGIYVDITDRKQAEEQIISSLKEKEVLLAEIHHRVKNNLAVITGLLELQSYNTENNNAKVILRESQMRIHSIALVHEKLYQNENLSEIQIHQYIQELAGNVEDTMGVESVPVEINYDLDDVSLVITQAIPCGLLLNEVLTNSYKHAFKGVEKGRIDINFKKEDEMLVFSIRDNGIGIQHEDQEKIEKSLGMKLIRTLSKQLNASMDIMNGDGTEFTFRFKKEGQED